MCGISPISVQCLQLTNPASGNVTLATSGTKTSATYTCVSGYNLNGNAISLCNSDGTWTLPPPTCCVYYLYNYLFICNKKQKTNKHTNKTTTTTNKQKNNQ